MQRKRLGFERGIEGAKAYRLKGSMEPMAKAAPASPRPRGRGRETQNIGCMESSPDRASRQLPSPPPPPTAGVGSEGNERKSEAFGSGENLVGGPDVS